MWRQNGPPFDKSKLSIALPATIFSRFVYEMMHWGTRWEFSDPNLLNNVISQVESLPKRQNYLDVVNYNYVNEKITQTNETQIDNDCDPQEKARSVLDCLEHEDVLNENELTGLSSRCLKNILNIVREELNDVTFDKFCKSLCQYSDEKVLNSCFDYVIQNKISQQETSLLVMNTITNLAKCKPDNITKCITKVITIGNTDFSNIELLQEVLPTLMDYHRDEILKVILNINNFNEENLLLLQELSQNVSAKSFNNIIKFLKCKREEFADSAMFGKLLVQICSNPQSANHKDALADIIDTHKTLYKKKALMNLTNLN